MAPPRQPGTKKSLKPKEVRTTLVLHEDLWKRAKQRALDDGTDLRSLLVEGLEWRLTRRKAGR